MKSFAPVLLWLMAFSAFAQEGIPKVKIDYGFVPFDRSAEKLLGTPIEKEAIKELYSRVEEFQTAWDEQGPELLKAVVEETGKPFLQENLRATMTLSKFRSMSHPLLLNMRSFLKTTAKDDPRPMSMFVGLVFHEVLHIYVYEILSNSSLREKYKDEPGSVLAHMHLDALLKMAYLKLDRKEELEMIIKSDTRKGRDIYIRAWQIVNEIEGHQVFVDEIKNSKPSGS